jgi:hypothetical protein
LTSPETSVELSEVSVDFSDRNASVAKTRNFELLCSEEQIDAIRDNIDIEDNIDSGDNIDSENNIDSNDQK